MKQKCQRTGTKINSLRSRVWGAMARSILFILVTGVAPPSPYAVHGVAQATRVLYACQELYNSTKSVQTRKCRPTIPVWRTPTIFRCGTLSSTRRPTSLFQSWFGVATVIAKTRVPKSVAKGPVAVAGNSSTASQRGVVSTGRRLWVCPNRTSYKHRSLTRVMPP